MEIKTIALIFSAITFALICISLCVRLRQRSIVIQALSCLTESVFNFLNNSLTGAVLCLVQFVRSILFYEKKKFSRRTYSALLVIFELLIIVSCIFTWDGPVSLLMTSGSLIRTYCLWQTNMRLIRFSGISSGLLIGAYYVCYDSWFMVAGYTAMLIVGVYEFWIKDIHKPKRQQLVVNK